MSRSTALSACDFPNHAESCCVRILTSSILAVVIRRSEPLVLRLRSPVCTFRVGDRARENVESEYQGEQHQGRGPGLLMPLLEWRYRIGEDLNGQRCDRLVEASGPEAIPERREEERRR